MAIPPAPKGAAPKGAAPQDGRPDLRPPGPRQPAMPGNRGRIAALVMVVVLAGALYMIGEAILHHNQVQNCLDSGRRDCQTRVNP